MRTGMLWLDNEPASTLEFKVKKAVNYYRQRYGQPPNLCFVHPSLLDQPESGEIPPIDIMGVQVMPSQFIEPEQLWLGYRELSKAAQAAAAKAEGR